MNIVTKIRVKSCPLGYQCLTRTVLSWLLKKAVSMALWTKASLCGKSSLSEQSLPRTPSRLRIICVNPVNLVKKTPCLGVFVVKKLSASSAFSAVKILRVVVYPEPAEGCLSGIFTTVKSPLQIHPFYAKQTQFAGCSNEHK